ncbi:MAG TPA: prolyl oligopeptidase family serine peptidase [Pseudonocardiaceae bacterium]|nr:prolyl oligopeptidase family serine peptidase [Pseudonocardiaceae bacterium]
MTGTGAQSPLPYPPAERLECTEQLHGHLVADPYRWLEDPADPRTVVWSAAQHKLAREVLDGLPGRAALAAELRRLLATGSVSVPVWRRGRAFFTRREPEGEHSVLYVRETGPDGSATERVLLDVMALDPSGLTTLDSWSPSREGDRLTYQISQGGDEESALYTVAVDTSELLEGPIDRCRYSPVAWLPGGEEIYYVRRLAPDQVPAGEEQFHRRVWRHRIGADPATDLLVHGADLDPTNYYGVRVSADGRWLLVDASPGTASRDSVWLADLHGAGELSPVLTETDAVRCSAWVGRDGRLYLLTTLGAARWRLCMADPTDPAPARWTELIAEDPGSVLDGIRWLEDPDGGEPLLVAYRTRHAVAELHLHTAAGGTHRGTIPLPGVGSLTGLSTVDELTPDGAGQVWIGWTDFATPPCVHRFDLRAASTELAEPAPGAVARPELHTQQVAVQSPDGTTVRMFVVSPTPDLDRPRPALLTGYGGFALSREPGYSAAVLAWVAAGGVWAQAGLRGGGEEGEDWHRAGMREHKMNTFADFHATADALVDRGWTTRDQLAISGGSNGGLLVGAALTQCPDAYRAVVCSAPLLDMVRYERFLLGRTWNDEYGSAEDPTELGWLLSYSPYHHVRPGVAYPAVLFTVFESDTRVDPMHARKMCAALQYATTADPARAPVLIRQESEAGHAARAVSRTVALAVDQLCFLAQYTGLDLETGPLPETVRTR